MSSSVRKYPFWAILWATKASKPNLRKFPVSTNVLYQGTLPKSKVFLAFCSYCRRYVQDFLKIARPLHQLTENAQDFVRNYGAREAFEFLKATLTSAPIFAFPSMREPSILFTDASQLAMSPVLAQIQNGSERFICYASKCFSKTKSRYSTTKRELLAIVIFTRHFKHYCLEENVKLSLITYPCSGFRISKFLMV